MTSRIRNIMIVTVMLLTFSVPSIQAQQTTLSPTTAARVVLRLVNRERRAEKLLPLQLDTRLMRAAQIHSQDMLTRDYFEHDTPEGDGIQTQFAEARYPLDGSWAVAQNIAKGQKTPRQVMDDWMDSPGHRKNILNPVFRDMGLGLAGGLWTQNFGMHE